MPGVEPIRRLPKPGFDLRCWTPSSRTPKEKYALMPDIDIDIAQWRRSITLQGSEKKCRHCGRPVRDKVGDGWWHLQADHASKGNRECRANSYYRAEAEGREGWDETSPRDTFAVPA